MDVTPCEENSELKNILIKINLKNFYIFIHQVLNTPLKRRFNEVNRSSISLPKRIIKIDTLIEFP